MKIPKLFQDLLDQMRGEPLPATAAAPRNAVLLAARREREVERTALGGRMQDAPSSLVTAECMRCGLTPDAASSIIGRVESGEWTLNRALARIRSGEAWVARADFGSARSGGA